MSSRDHCDVLVVGGGPAGSACARRLGLAGLDVLVMDKAAFPRDKVCAGWITPGVVESLDLDPFAYADGRVLQPVRGFRIGTIGGRWTDVDYAAPVSYGILRREFDHYLLARAAVRTALGEPVLTLVRERGAWLVNGRVRTPLVIGAGGHFCPVARALGSSTGRAGGLVVAQECEWRPSARQWRDGRVDQGRVQLWFCPDLKGYGWCFAKGDYLNVGLGREDASRLPRHVDAFRAWLRSSGILSDDAPARFEGHAYTLYPSSGRHRVADGALLVGDAAGLAWPSSGEGILPAVQSGAMAAEVVLEANGDYRREALAPYAMRLEQRYGAGTSLGALTASAARIGALRAIAARMLATPWFARHVVLDRGFLRATGGRRTRAASPARAEPLPEA